MDLTFILILVFVLLLVSGFLFFTGRKKQENRLRPLVGLAFGCILAGVLFTENRFFSYGMMGLGIVVALADILIRSRNQ